jgi:hypothetical protein
LEQARRSTLADHVHRNARLGLQVLIRESWYERSREQMGLSAQRPDFAVMVLITIVQIA